MVSRCQLLSLRLYIVDGSHSLQAACHQGGYDFRYEKHGNWNAVERVFREIKRRTICFSNCFSNAKAGTADDWIRSLSFAWNQLICTLPVCQPQQPHYFKLNNIWINYLSCSKIQTQWLSYQQF